MTGSCLSVRACARGLLWLCLWLTMPLAHAEDEVPIDSGLSPAVQQWLLDALDRNPGVSAARAAVEAAEARLRAASRPLYNPELDLEAEQAETRTGTLGLSQTIDWSDKREARTQVAARELEAAKAEHAERRRRVAGELLRGLARYHTAVRLDRLSQQRVDLMRRFLELAEKRHAAGDLSKVELELARLAFTQVRLERSQAAGRLVEAEQSLLAVAGIRPPSWPALPRRLPPLGQVDPQALASRLPEVRRLQAEVAAARSRVGLRERERRPDPTLGIVAGQERAYRGSDDDRFGVVGLSLSIPLFVRNDFRAEVEAAGADLARLEKLVQDRLQRAVSGIAAAAERYRLERAAWETWLQAGQESLSAQLDLLERFWRVGELSSAEYLVQINQTLDTRVTAQEVRGRLLEAWADWLVESGQIIELLQMRQSR